MRIVISPAKKMRTAADSVPESEPRFLQEAREIRRCLEELRPDERKALWKCSDRIARDGRGNGSDSSP